MPISADIKMSNSEVLQNRGYLFFQSPNSIYLKEKNVTPKGKNCYP